MGIALQGEDNEIANNFFSGNTAWCSYDFGQDGAAVEVYGARHNNIHHNLSLNDTTFSELGNDAEGNTFAYNLYVNTAHYRSDFLVLRGLGDRAYNNSVYLTGGDGRDLTSEADPSTVVRNNVFFVAGHPIYADGPIAKSNNIFWTYSLDPPVNFRGFDISPTSRVIDPQFVDPGVANLRLQANSPGRDAGNSESVERGYSADLAGRSMPVGSAPDIGAYEYGADPVVGRSSFPGLPRGYPAREAISAFAALGIIWGYNDSRVGVNDPVLMSQTPGAIGQPLGGSTKDHGIPFTDSRGTVPTVRRIIRLRTSTVSPVATVPALVADSARRARSR